MVTKYFTAEATAGSRGGLSDDELEQGYERLDETKEDWMGWPIDAMGYPQPKTGMSEIRMMIPWER